MCQCHVHVPPGGHVAVDKRTWLPFSTPMSESEPSVDDATPSLQSLLDGPAGSDDEALEQFLDWTIDLGLELYPAQEDAVLELFAGRHVVLDTPTGSGKSLVAVAMHFRAMKRGERSVYTSPIKALVSEKFFSLCRDFGADNVGMLTGDASINRQAPILCCTAEVLSNMVLREGGGLPIEHVVMDEFHYYADRDRGMAWQVPLLTMHRATFLLMSATLGDTAAIRESIEGFTGQEMSVVHSLDRPVPLEFEYRETLMHETIQELVAAGRAPIYLVNFSQREAAEQAQNLMSVNFTSKEDKKTINGQLKGFRFDSPYGAVMRRYLGHGVGLHHAGLLPKYRLLVEKLSQQGLLKVISGTDTLGVGVNIPIRTVLLSKLCKYDGERTRILSVREFRQITGRAGRKGFDDKGWVAAQPPEHVVENKRLAQKAAAGKKKKVRKRQPPQRGYVPWDGKTFERLCSKPCEPLNSVFFVDHGVMLNLLQRTEDPGRPGGGYRALGDLISASHEGYKAKRRLRRESARLFKSLVEAGIVELQPRDGGRGKRIVVSEELQRNFSLHQSQSLFLIHALSRLEPTDETYALDLLTLVESILEHPRPVLAGQVNKLKGQLVARLKADGMPYEERMEKLEEVTWPRPNAEWIYAVYNHFSQTHPWLLEDHIRPKSVARDMFERYLTINDYIVEYGLQRMEGVLLRYLSQAYKALTQIVPDYHKTEEVVDMAAYLRAALARVDSSLVQEWEKMRDEPLLGEEEEAMPRPPQPHITADERAFTARVRAELHRLVKALADRDYDEAVLCLRQDPDAPWTAERFEEAMASFYSGYERVIFDHRARLADKTVLTKTGFRCYDAAQILVDPDEDNYFSIDAVIDLSEEEEVSDDPLFTVLRIGA